MLLAAAGSMMAQTPEEKAAAKAAAAAEKAAVKEATSQMSQGMKLRDEVMALFTANQAELAKGDKANADVVAKNEANIKIKSQQASDLLAKALRSGKIVEKKQFDGWKALDDVSSQLLNPELQLASQNQAFDTVCFAGAVRNVADALHGQLKTGNPKDELQKPALATAGLKLPKIKTYFAYLTMFYIQDKRIPEASAALEEYIGFETKYPEVANEPEVKNPTTPPAQLAFNIYYTAYQQKDWATMEKFYDQAMKFDDPDSHNFVVQSRPQMYLQQGDSAKWEACMKEMIKADPKSEGAETAIWNLCANLAKNSDNDKLNAFIDECLSLNGESKSANIWKGRFLKTQRKNTEAIKYLEKAGEIDPNEAMVQELIGECYYDIAIENNKDITAKIDKRKYANQAAANKDIEAKVKTNMRKAIEYFEKAISASEAGSDIAKYSQNYIDEISRLLK